MAAVKPEEADVADTLATFTSLTRLAKVAANVGAGPTYCWASPNGASGAPRLQKDV